jgi:hypothetical protein
MTLEMLTGCHPKNGDAKYPVCVDTATAVAADELTPGGFAATDVLALTAGARDELLTWHDQTTTPLVLEVVSDGAGSQWIDSVADYTGVTIDIGIECPSRLEVPATFDFATEDGSFTEHFDVTLVATTVDAAELHVDLMKTTLSGSFDPTDWPTDDYDSMEMSLNANFDAAGDSGTIAGSTLKDEGCVDDTCSASSEQLDVAAWGVSAGR